MKKAILFSLAVLLCVAAALASSDHEHLNKRQHAAKHAQKKHASQRHIPSNKRFNLPSWDSLRGAQKRSEESDTTESGCQADQEEPSSQSSADDVGNVPEENGEQGSIVDNPNDAGDGPSPPPVENSELQSRHAHSKRLKGPVKFSDHSKRMKG